MDIDTCDLLLEAKIFVSKWCEELTKLSEIAKAQLRIYIWIQTEMFLVYANK